MLMVGVALIRADPHDVSCGLRHAARRRQYSYFSSNSFGKEFTTAVEQKQIAQQDAERAKFVVEKAEQERQAAVIRAEGEAEAAATIGKALDRAGEAFVAFRKIEASKDIGAWRVLEGGGPVC